MNTEKLIKVQAGSEEKTHYSAKLAGRNRRPVCGTSSRMAYFTQISDSRTDDKKEPPDPLTGVRGFLYCRDMNKTTRENITTGDELFILHDTTGWDAETIALLGAGEWVVVEETDWTGDVKTGLWVRYHGSDAMHHIKIDSERIAKIG